MIIQTISYIDKEQNELDEVVLHAIDTVHIERMDNGHIWMAFYSGKDCLMIDFRTNRNAKIFGKCDTEHITD